MKSVSLNALLHNKILLNIVFILTILNLIGFIMYGKINIVIIFILITGILYKISDTKNMIIILGVPLILVNLISVLTNREGLTDMSNNAIDFSHNMTDMSRNPAALIPVVKNLDTDVNKLDMDVNKIIKKKRASTIHGPIGTDETSSDSNENEMEEPDAYTTDTLEGFNKKQQKYRVDYASTIEDAYKDLDKVLNSEGIKNLTEDTHNLMKKQIQLAETMKSMAPLVQSMAPLLKQAKSLFGGANIMPAVV